jgi:serine/threonine protein kinase
VVSEPKASGEAVPTVRPGKASGESLSSSGTRETATGVLARPQQIIGRYRLLTMLAEGGMAQVWAARPESGGLARTVVIKLVLPHFATDEHYARMFIDEAMIASSIHHPNVCEILELGKHEGLLFMVLEWVPGDTISGLVQRSRQALPDPIAARIISDACAGLHAAHEALGPEGLPLGVVHRDISPQNILVSLNGHPKLSDFGIAKARLQLHARTEVGEIKGKFAYVAPEQIRGAPVDRRADIYSMGCVLYVATTGQRPFGAGASALGKIVQGAYALPSELRADYPLELEAIIKKALSASAEDRFQTAEEMQIALEHWLLSLNSPITHAQVAALVAERLSVDRRTLIDALRSTARIVPETVALRLASRQELTNTPTARALLAASAKNNEPKSKTPQALTPNASTTFTVPQFRNRNQMMLLCALGLLALVALFYLVGHT